MSAPLRFGVFITPFHPIGQSPTVALEYDMERVVALDRLGFDEAWFGEHHSGGYELIACPGGVHRGRSRADQTHPAGHRSGLAALPPSADGGRSLGVARPPDPRPGHVRHRPGRAAVGRLHDGYRPGRSAADDAGVARGDPRAVPRRAD